MEKYNNLSIISENREYQRAYYIPYSSRELAVKKDKNSNERYIELNGEWEFTYFKSPLDFPDNINDLSFDKKLPVPSCWECYGYGQIQYTNINYPFQYDPPYTLSENPVGVYSREFEVTSLGTVYVVFEGVSSFLELYVNGKYVGLSRGSHLQAEFDITEYITDGKNTITAVVYTYNAESYLEDQDCYRYHGIFRDVYLLNRPEEHIRDVYIKPEISGKVNLDITFTGESMPYDVTYIMPSGDEAKEISDPVLWSAEKPNLYGVLIHCNGEYIYKKIGFRTVGTSDKGELLINGVSVKLKGVNRHDTHPKYGYCVTEADMIQDIVLMKQHNINCVRTSHYPNHPEFLELCDEYGLYVMDECDIETHGIEHAYGLCSAASIKEMASNPAWTLSYLDRIKRMVERDKNSSSVIVWSLGNEGQFGDNFVKMSEWIKSVDKTRLVHYERTAFPNKAYGADQMPIHPCVDIISRMYTSLENMEIQGNMTNDKRPYFLAEYCHAMGLGPGEVKDYWDIIYKYPRMIGGCVWEWCDHAVEKDLGNGKIGYLYGGDCGEFPHDGNFCCDGLVFPDRTPSTGLLEYKKVIEPLRVKCIDIKEGRFEFENLYDFSDLGEFDFEYRVLRDGDIAEKGNFEVTLPPHGTCEVKLNYSIPASAKHCVYVEIYMNTKENVKWCDKGWNLAWAQFELPVSIDEKAKAVRDTISVTDAKRYVSIKVKDAVYTFDMAKGMLCSINKEEKELLKRPCDLVIWRAMTDNDVYQKPAWTSEHLHKTYFKPRTYEVNKTETECVIKINGALGANSRLPAFNTDIVYTVTSAGVNISIYAVKNDKLMSMNRSSKEETELDLNLKTEIDEIPRFGMRFAFDCEFENLKYFGKGDRECYIDYQEHARMGIWESTVTKEYEPYIVPQDCGNHMNTRWLELTEHSGLCARISSSSPFEFSALHYGIEQMDSAAHAFEIEPLDTTELLICYKNRGVGSCSCGPKLSRKYCVTDKLITMDFDVEIGDNL